MLSLSSGQTFVASNEFTVSDSSLSNIINTAVQVLTDQSFVVCWDGLHGTPTFATYGQFYDSTGQKIGTQIIVNTYQVQNQYIPSVTTDGSSYYIFWQGAGQGAGGHDHERRAVLPEARRLAAGTDCFCGQCAGAAVENAGADVFVDFGAAAVAFAQTAAYPTLPHR